MGIRLPPRAHMNTPKPRKKTRQLTADDIKRMAEVGDAHFFEWLRTGKLPVEKQKVP